MLINLWLATALVRLILAGSISGGGGGSLSVNVNWGSSACFSGSPCTSTSATRTFSGSGQIRLDKTGAANSSYSLNAGSFTSFSTGQLLTIANADTLAFKSTNLGAVSLNIVDTGTSASIGTCDLSNDFDPGGGSAEP